MFEGYNEHFTKLIPNSPDILDVFPIVFCHNDAQENNILMELFNNKHMLIIDYEYGGWNPLAMDMANYLNETMLDNSYPDKNGIAWYLDNCMTHEELKCMCSRYLSLYFERYLQSDVKAKFSKSDEFLSQYLEQYLKQVYNCALLNNLFWGVWAISLLKPDNCTEPAIFNYDFAMSRVEMFYKVKEIMSELGYN